MQATYKFTRIPLPYSFDSLLPHIDTETVKLHYTKHLQTYIDNLNRALQPYPIYHNATLTELILYNHRLPGRIRTDVRRNAGGVYNHNLYFYGMTPDFGGAPLGKLAHAINSEFGSTENFRNKLREEALSRFGSGWAFLAADRRKNLKIVSTPNQETDLTMNLTPIIACDVWEHAYYLKYKNRRDEYFDNWFEVINWHFAEELFSNNSSH